jgi:GntR family transcriptional regulator
MDIVINNNSNLPIYEQIRRQLTGQILNGELEAGYCLPPIRTVAAETGISVITVKKAWELLEADGLIYTQAGKGCFVADHCCGRTLHVKRLEMAAAQFTQDAAFYRSLNITPQEMLAMVRKLYKD